MPKFFPRTVRVMLKPGIIDCVSSISDAAQFLMARRWPKRGPAVEEAARVLARAAEDRASSRHAMEAFVAAARESRVLVTARFRK